MVYYRRRSGSANYRSNRRYASRGKFSRGNWTTKNNKAAANQSQTQFVQATTVTSEVVEVAIGSSSTTKVIDLSQALLTNQMAKSFSYVYDQYRVRKISVKITPLGSSIDQYYYTVGTAIDRNGFKPSVTLSDVRTYSSYKQSVYASASSNTVKPHYITIQNDTLFNKSAYYSTKTKPQMPVVAMAVGYSGTSTAVLSTSFTIELKFDICYRGIRFDSTEPAYSVNPAIPE